MSDSIISLNGDILAKNGRILKSLNGGGGASYTAGAGIDITSNTISVKSGNGLKICTTPSVVPETPYYEVDPWSEGFTVLQNASWMSTSDGTDTTFTIYIDAPYGLESELIKFIDENDYDSTNLKVYLIRNYKGDVSVETSTSWINDGFTIIEDYFGMYTYVAGEKVYDEDSSYASSHKIFKIEFTVTGNYANDSEIYLAFASDNSAAADFGGQSTELDNNYCLGFTDVAFSSALLPAGQLAVDTLANYDGTSNKPATCKNIQQAIDNIPFQKVDAGSLVAGSSHGDATYTSNSVTIDKSFWSSNIYMQDESYSRSCVLYGRFTFSVPSAPSNGVATTGTITITDPTDSANTITMPVTFTQLCRTWDDNGTTKAAITVASNPFMPPIDCYTGDGDPYMWYLTEIHIDFAGLTSGGTDLVEDECYLNLAVTRHTY